MRLIIAGSRSIGDDTFPVIDAIITVARLPVSEVVSGGARGADELGERWAAEHGVALRRFPADWKRYGRAAGHLRNWEMREYGEALLALWDGSSAGTRGMISAMRSKVLPRRPPVLVWQAGGGAMAELLGVLQREVASWGRLGV